MRGLTAATAALLIALTAPALSPVARAQDDWGVKRDPFDKRLVARYKRLLAKNPGDRGALARLIAMYRRYRSVEALVAEYERDHEAKPVFATAVVLGHLYLEVGDRDRARARYEEAAALQPDAHDVHVALGAMHRGDGAVDAARAAYERALATARTAPQRKQVLRELAGIALDAGDIEGARGYFDQYIALDPKNVDARLELADALAHHDRHRDALAVLADAETRLRSDPQRRVEVIARMGAAHEALGEDEAAVREYRRAIKLTRRGYYLRRELTERIIDIHRKRQDLPALIAEYEREWPAGARGHFEWDVLARLYEETGDQESAIAAYRKAVAKAPHELDTQRRLIALLEHAGREDEALDRYEAVARVAPGEPRFQLELAERYWNRGKPDKALDLLAKVARRFPDDPGVHAALADLYSRWGKEDLALAAYERLARVEPDEPDHLVNLGEQHFQRGARDKAIAVWKRIAAKKDAKGWARLAEVYAEHDMRDEALAAYAKAIALEPDNPERYRGRARVYERSRQWSQAVADWERALELTPTEPVARPARREARKKIVMLLNNQGTRVLRNRMAAWTEQFAASPPSTEAGYFLVESHLKLGETERAQRTLERLLQLDASDRDAMELLVKVYRDRGEYARAIEVLERLAASSPGQERIYYAQIAELQAELYNDEAAIAYSEKALAASPNDPTAHEELARTYERMQQYDKAIAAYERVIELDPRNFRVYFRLAELHVRDGKRDRAAELYRLVLRRATDEQVLHRAGQRAIDLEEYLGTLGELERVVAPLAFTFTHKKVYRTILVELYDRYVRRLVARLRSEDPEVRAAARAELDRLGKLALKPLLEALADDGDPAQRRIAVNALGYVGNRGAAMPLVKLAAEPPTSRGARGLTTLAPALDLDLRVEALVAAGRLRDPRTVPVLLDLLRHRDVALREAAVFALGMTGDRRALPALIEALGDQHASVRAVACFGLAGFDDARARDAMIRVIREPGEEAPRAACAFALGAGEHRAAIPALIETVGDGNDEVQRMAAWSLGRLGDRRALPALLAAFFTKGPRVREAAAWALPRVVAGPTDGGDAAPLAALAEYPMRAGKYDPDTAIRTAAGELDAPPVSAALILGHEDAITAGIREALGRHRDLVVRVLRDLDARDDGPALGLLTARLDSASPEDRDRVREVLRRVGEALFAELDGLARDSRDGEVRRLALSVVAKLALPKSADTLIAGLADGDRGVREAALAAAARYAELDGPARDRLVAPVVAALGAEHWRERAAAATALASFGDQAPSEPLLAALRDPNGFVREAAARAVGRLRRTSAVPALLELTADRSPAVQLAAVDALVAIGDPRAAVRMAELAREADDPAVRAAASRFGRKK